MKILNFKCWVANHAILNEKTYNYKILAKETSRSLVTIEVPLDKCEIITSSLKVLCKFTAFNETRKYTLANFNAGKLLEYSDKKQLLEIFIDTLGS